MEEKKTVTLSSEVLGPHIEAIVSQGGSFTLTVTGGSMVPTLRHLKSTVVLVKPDDLRPGDIVFFRRKTGAYILHRILRVRGTELTVNGDAQSWTETVDISQVIAKAASYTTCGRTYTCGTPSQQAYHHLWHLTRPLRPMLLKAYSALKKK